MQNAPSINPDIQSALDKQIYKIHLRHDPDFERSRLRRAIDTHQPLDVIIKIENALLYELDHYHDSESPDIKIVADLACMIRETPVTDDAFYQFLSDHRTQLFRIRSTHCRLHTDEDILQIAKLLADVVNSKIPQLSVNKTTRFKILAYDNAQQVIDKFYTQKATETILAPITIPLLAIVRIIRSAIRWIELRTKPQ